MNLSLLLNLVIAAVLVLNIVTLRRRRNLLREAGNVLWNMPETDDEHWERRAVAVMQQIEKEVGVP